MKWVTPRPQMSEHRRGGSMGPLSARGSGIAPGPVAPQRLVRFLLPYLLVRALRG